MFNFLDNVSRSWSSRTAPYPMDNRLEIGFLRLTLQNTQIIGSKTKMTFFNGKFELDEVDLKVQWYITVNGQIIDCTSLWHTHKLWLNQHILLQSLHNTHYSICQTTLSTLFHHTAATALENAVSMKKQIRGRHSNNREYIYVNFFIDNVSWPLSGSRHCKTHKWLNQEGDSQTQQKQIYHKIRKSFKSPNGRNTVAVGSYCVIFDSFPRGMDRSLYLSIVRNVIPIDLSDQKLLEIRFVP